MRTDIRQMALYFLDQEEITGNQGFVNPKFEQLMKMTGWEKGQAWCSYFAELVWTQAGVSAEKWFSGSAVETWNNFKDTEGFERSEKPTVGALVIWQNYKDGQAKWSGHAGIVIHVQGNQIVTVEGNTNDSGGREGIEVALKIRRIDFKTNNGLRLRGFVRPIIN